MFGGKWKPTFFGEENDSSYLEENGPTS